MTFVSLTTARRPVRILALVAVAATALVAFVASRAGAAPGNVDRTFGRAGLTQLGGDTQLIGAATQRNGRLVAVGVQGQEAGSARLLVARFTRAGKLDRTFSGNGTFVGPAGTVGRDLTVQADGKIVVAGALAPGAGNLPEGMLVMRLKPGGGIDRSFSGDGKATALTSQRGQALAVTLAGKKIVVGGSARTGDGLDRTAVARFNPNGSADNGFGSRGAAVLDFGRLTFANDVAVQRNGRIVIAGSQRNNLQTTAVLAARLTSKGAPDRSFGGNAGLPGLFVQQYAKGAGYSAAFGVALVGGGKIVLGGSATVAAQGNDAIAVRLTAAGKPDKTFSGDGIAYLPATTNNNQYEHNEPLPGALGLAVSGGDILLGGYFDDFSVKSLAVWALRGNGALDKRFGKGGRTLTPIEGGLGGQLNDLVVARGGDIYGVGRTSAFFGPTKGLAVGYHGFR